MAIFVGTEDPPGLLAALRQAIDDGRVRTWVYDSDGDFTQTAEQWKARAWLRPRQEQGRVVFNIIAPGQTTLSTTVYAVYHGRFIEMLLMHFDRKLARATASSLATKNDAV